MTNRSLGIRGFVLLLAVSFVHGLQAQDTLRVTIQEAEKIFTEKNLQVLAEKYNIDIAKAQIIQERLYNNPTVQLTGALYNPVQNKVFDVSRTGQYDVSVQQLITLAGKRNKRVQLATTASSQAENSFFDLLRTLNFSLRSAFYTIHFLQNSINAYTEQVNMLEKLNSSYALLQEKGNVTLKDAVRIRSLLYSLKAEQAGLINQLNDAEADLQLLLQNNKAFVLPQVTDPISSTTITALQLPALLDTAYANRSDLLLANNTLLYSKQNYTLQRALRVPDLTVGAEFDKRGSYVNNASFLNVAMDLPFFNRNQGNIKAAKISIQQSQVQLDLQKQTVENDVQRSYIKVLNTDKMLQSFDPNFRQQFEKLMNGVTENFQKKNISMIDFTDFVESYKNNILQVNQLQNDRMQAIQALNFAVGKSIIN